MAALLNDAYPSWAFNTPGIVASADLPGVEMRVRVDAVLSGTYWMATSGADVTLDVDGDTRTVRRATLSYAGNAVRAVTIRAAVPTGWWTFTMVRADAIDPRRDFLAAPPEVAPASVREIR
jgi:hypothetical protein